MALVSPRYRLLSILLIASFFAKVFSFNAGWVERFYSLGIYPWVGKALRLLVGWVPFSMGDVAYLLAGGWLAVKFFSAIKKIIGRKLTRAIACAAAIKLANTALAAYLFFTLFWGLNYYRQGIAPQLGMRTAVYARADLQALLSVLQQRLMVAASASDSMGRLRYNQNQTLFDSSAVAYRPIAEQYPFLTYTIPSIKPSVFTPVGHWFGFTGYYNPFTAEAQLKTTVPVFLKPFVVTHEVAHQLGYAKENEANFVAWLTCKSSGNPEFVYSAYFEVFRDVLFDYRRQAGRKATDSIVALLPSRVRYDWADLNAYLLKQRNPIEPFMSGAYDRYLKLHNQPAGKATYNEVVGYLVAYMKKFGAPAL